MSRPYWARVLVLALIAESVPAGAGGSRVTYVGGTSATLAPKSGGTLSTIDEEVLRIEFRKSPLEVRYKQVNLVEYGQKVERRYILAILISPLFLLAKSRRHYLTLGYTNEAGRQQALTFRVGKGDIRPLLAALEARTGLRVTYQDEEARKAGKG